MKKKLSSLLFVAVVSVLLLGSCLKTKDYYEIERQNIDKYISENPDLNFTRKESGLYYYEVTAGTGAGVRQHDTVKVFYTGRFLDGYTFDTNIGNGRDTLKFPAGESKVIPGFDEGVYYMKEGGKSIILVPSSLAYGPGGWYTIPGYTPLLFEITLAKVTPGVEADD